MYNFSELKANVAVIVQRSADTNYKTQIGTWINLAYQRLYSSYDYFVELEDTHVFSTASGTESYYMPNHFEKPLRIKDMTNTRDINLQTEENYVDANLGSLVAATTGKPSIARIYGAFGVKRQVSSSGDTLKANSSSSSDTSGIVVRVEGYIDSALTIVDFENINISTTSPTSYVSGTKTFYKILHVSKSADTTGYITLADSSSNVLAILGSIDRTLTHKVMKLGLIPNATISIKVWFKRKFNKLVNDYDYPFTESDDFLITEACGYAYMNEKESADRAAAMFQKANESLNSILLRHQGRLGPDYQHRMISPLVQAHRA